MSGIAPPSRPTSIVLNNPAYESSPFDGFKDALTCPICCSTFTKPIITTQCAHTFCYKCIVKIENSPNENENGNSCPICRADLDNSYRYRNLSMESVLDEYRKNSVLDYDEVEDIVDENDENEKLAKSGNGINLFEMHGSSPRNSPVRVQIESVSTLDRTQETNRMNMFMAMILIVVMLILLKKLNSYETHKKMMAHNGSFENSNVSNGTYDGVTNNHFHNY